MVKKKKEVKKEVKGEVVHVMKLLNQLSRRLPDCHFEVEERKRVRGFLESIEEGIKKMDEQDEELQNQPENKKKSLRAEIIKNDEILKRNKEERRLQVQMGLYRKGYPQTSPYYDSMIESLELEIEDLQLKIDSKFKVVNPTFQFQNNSVWIETQNIIHKRMLKAKEDNLKEIKGNVEEVKKEISEQTARMKERRRQIIEELKELKADVSDFPEKPPDYIN